MRAKAARLVTAAALALAAACSAGGARPAAVDASGGAGRPALDEATFAKRRQEMVARQIAARGVEDPAVLQALRDVPRHRFVNPGDEGEAYEDHPLGIGLGQTISQPYIVGAMTEALRPKPGMKVLEIGTGSGYQAAVLARLCREVYTIEIVPELAERAGRTLTALGVANVRVRAGDGYQGWPEAAPFDAIMITAATPRIPQPLIDQLAEGGRLVAPVDEPGHQILYAYRKTKGALERFEMFPVRFVPMTGQVRDAKPR
jgi:protein-L-isoaspartate(D-aspartate) O-methyltransferase